MGKDKSALKAHKTASAPAAGVGDKGKAKATPKTAVDSVTTANDDESEWSSEDEDEENGGVSEKGMQRLMELVGEEDLDEVERARLGMESDEDEEEDGEEVEGESGDEEEGGSEMDDESDEEDEDEEEDDDEEEDGELVKVSYILRQSGPSSFKQKLDNSVLIDEADPDAIAMDDIGSEASLDEDTVPMRKLLINNKVSLACQVEQRRI
jgi:rRNA-processing protein EBP2